MTSRNEVTGKMIVVGAEPDSKLYDEGWERIFGKSKTITKSELEAKGNIIICDVCTRIGCTECQREVE